jgi:hypothetical protein
MMKSLSTEASCRLSLDANGREGQVHFELRRLVADLAYTAGVADGGWFKTTSQQFFGLDEIAAERPVTIADGSRRW